MKCKNSGWICCIIAIFILFAGMCVDQPKAGSLFVCTENYPTDSYITTSQRNLRHYELSTTEMLGIRNTSFISGYVKRSVIRFSQQLSLHLCMAALQLLRLYHHQAVSETGRMAETHYSAVLLHYIHSQDGKK